MRVVISLLCLVQASSVMAAGNCHVDNYRFVFGQDSSASMTTKAGTPCSSHINDQAGVTSSVIAQQPANGTAWVSDNHHWAYKSRPGYSGPDAFVVAVDGSSSSNNRGRTFSGTTRISVNVTVQ